MPRHQRLILIVLLLLGVAAFFASGLHRHLSLAALKAGQGRLQAWQSAHPLAAVLGFAGLYVLVTALSLPGAAVLTLAGGAFFGLGLGALVVSLASTVGATLAFLAARGLLRDQVRQRWPERVARIDEGVARDGAFYLLSLRLVPAVPFFVVNLALGLTGMRVATYAWVSQLGMLPGTLVFVNAGTRLGAVQSPADVLSPGIAGALLALGLLPWVARRGLEAWQGRRALAPWRRPARFDRNLIVIGGGSAGLVTAYIAAALRARVTLVEAHRLGGDCLNTGCVPSKALIRSAKAAVAAREAGRFGVHTGPVQVDFAAVMARVHTVVQAIEPHDSAERYRGLGVEVVMGRARLLSPWEVEITGTDGGVQRLSARHLVLATGARPTLPSLPGLDLIEPLTSDNLWQLTERPARLLVLGGGPIGCELAQAFARLGSEVTQVELAPRLLAREDEEVSALVQQALEADGVRVMTGHAARRVTVTGGQAALWVEAQAGTAPGGLNGQHGGGSSDGTRGDTHAERALPFDRLLVAVGRTANLEGFGLEALGIRHGRTLDVDGFMRTNLPTVLAAGDVAGPWQFTHMAAHQAWYAAVNALFAPFKRFRVRSDVVPWVTFTSPEVARVGLSVAEAQARGVPFELTRYELDDLDRAIAEGATRGFIQVLTVPGRDRILGVSIVGEHAGELLPEFVLAMTHGLGLGRLLATIHPYPGWSDAVKAVAGRWRQAHAPAAALRVLESLHRWQRGGTA